MLDVSEVFQNIRPLTVLIAQKPELHHLKALHQTLDDVDDTCLQQLQEYCLFPLRMLLKRHGSITEAVLIEGLSCLTSIIERTEIRDVTMFRDVYTSLCMAISQPDGTLRQGVAEEVLMAVLRCLSGLVRNINFPNGLIGLYEVTWLPACGHSISLLLALCQHHSYRQVQCRAIKALMNLASLHRQLSGHDVCVIGRYFASFLPGVSTGLCRVIMGDYKQGHKVIQMALTAWSGIVALVLDDHCALDDPDSPKSGPAEFQRLVTTRDEVWLKQTTEKLCVLIRQVSALTSHQHWTVRGALVTWATLLLEKCWRSLTTSRSLLLNVLLTSMNDDDVTVAEQCRQVLRDVMCMRNTDRYVTSLLEEHIYDLCTALPRLIRSQGEESNMTSLRLLLGYLQLLGSELSPVMKTSVCSRRLYECLLQVVEIDVTHIRVVEERRTFCKATSVLTDDTMTSLPEKPRSQFAYLQQSHFQIVCQICQTLATVGDVDLLINLCMESVHGSDLHRKEAILLANNFVQSLGASHDRGRIEDCVSILVSEYLQPEIFDVEIDALTASQQTTLHPGDRFSLLSVGDEPGMRSSAVRTMNSNIQQISLLLNGLAHSAKVCGDRFQPHLKTILFPILVRLGSSNHVITEAAHWALIDIAHACKYRCLNDLVCENADYLINSLSLRMRHFADDHNAPRVLKVMMDVCESPSLLVQLRDVIDEILVCLDDNYRYRSGDFLVVLGSLVAAILRWYPPLQVSIPLQETSKTKTTPQNKNVTSSSVPDDAVTSSPVPVDVVTSSPVPGDAVTSSPVPGDNMTSRLLNYVRRLQQYKRISDNLTVDEADYEDVPGITGGEDGDGEGVGAEEENKVIPTHITIVKNVLSRCLHLMSHSDARRRLLVLDITSNGLHCLAQHPDELLPMAHLIWSPLLPRLRDEDHLVIVKAFRLLCIMADVCEDFLSQRVRKQVLPQLTCYLTSQADISSSSSDIYRQTVAYKTQLILLKQLGKLAQKLKLTDRYCDTVYEAARPYLSSRQPTALQQAAAECIADLDQLEPDLIWLRLVSCYVDKLPSPPGGNFRPVKITAAPAREDYKTNVTALLNELAYRRRVT